MAEAWHECVAVSCGFHACVVGQSVYEPQLRAWLNLFSAPQALVLTLDEFATAPRGVRGASRSALSAIASVPSGQGHQAVEDWHVLQACSTAR